MRVMVTSAGTATAVGLMKAIRRSDSEATVVACDINSYGHTAGSMLADMFEQVPLATDKEFVPQLLGRARSLGIDLLIPVNDSEVEALAIAKKEGADLPRCILPTVDVVRLVRDKRAMTGRAMSLGIPCPESADLFWRGDRVVRPVEGVGSKGVTLLKAGDDPSVKTVSAVQAGDAIVQRYVGGDEYTVDVLSGTDGQVVACVPRRRVEVKAGVATKVEIVRDDALMSHAKRVCESLGLPGFSNVQFRKDALGMPCFIEVNPRFGGCSIASVLTTEGLFEAFLEIAGEQTFSGARGRLGETRWGAFVCRYQEEVVYEGA